MAKGTPRLTAKVGKRTKIQRDKVTGKRIRGGTLVTQAMQDAFNADQGKIEVIADHTKEVVEAIDTALVRALEEVGLVAEGYAKKLCPVDTGRLRNSITHTISNDGKFAQIGTNVEYAPSVELGRSGSKYKGANDGRGFLRPAATDHVNTYRKIIEKHLRNG